MRLSVLAAGIACLSSAFLSGCGDSSSGSNTIHGSVAVGVPLADALVRVVDATGAPVAESVVVAPDGNYPSITLTGSAPYRLEACGNHGLSYVCLYSVANRPGRANITPLTNAVVLLATGASPAAIMDGVVTGLDAASVQNAQEVLQLSLADVLDSAGVASDLDFIRANLVAGSHEGYDFVLDSLDVTTGAGAEPFVQITPRLGTGNVFIEPGSPPVGELTVPPAAAGLSLAGIDTLFDNLTASLASLEACTAPVTGIRAYIADDARMSTGGDPLVGGDAVAASICGVFGQEFGPPFGSAFANPTIGRCDLSGPAARCRMSFLLQAPGGQTVAFVENIGVTEADGVWKLFGELDVVPIHAATRARRTTRVDDVTAVSAYARAIGFDIPAVAGLACARVSQGDAAGQTQTVAFYKLHSPEASRLSVWMVDDSSGTRSLDPASGVTHGYEDPWLVLPEGMEWDDVIRNFQQGGRTATVNLFSDAACSEPLSVEGQSEFVVDVPGLPPVWAAMNTVAWPNLTDTAVTELVQLALGQFTNGSYAAAWSFLAGSSSIEQGAFCIDGDCTMGAGSWLGNTQGTAGVNTLTIPLSVGEVALESSSYKVLVLSGRTPDGLGIQSNSTSCPMTMAGMAC